MALYTTTPTQTSFRATPLAPGQIFTRRRDVTVQEAKAILTEKVGQPNLGTIDIKKIKEALKVVSGSGLTPPSNLSPEGE